MKKFRFLALAVAALTALTITSTLRAGTPAKPTPFAPHHTLIGSISAESITVNTFSGSKTYKITKYTSMTFQGKTVTAADLKPGMKVSVVAGTDPDTADTITASAPPKDPAPAASAAKPKGK